MRQPRQRLGLLSHDDILSEYSEVSLLKRGGQRAVYRVTDPKLGVVVLKIGQYSSPQALERIRREVGVLRGIDSPYFPKNLSFETRGGNTFILVEEYVPSRPLSECLGEFTAPRRALRLAQHLVVGLDLLWQKRVVHRDVKPDNILITSNGKPKIIDLGIARLLDSESLTRTLNAVGPCTPVYAAPEQLRNRKAKIDHRTDQFNLGIIFVQLLLGGRHPFDPRCVGRGESIVANILNNLWASEVFRGLNLPGPWNRLALRLLGNEPFMRYRTTAELVAGLGACEEKQL